MTEQQRKAYEEFVTDAENWTFAHFKTTAAPSEQDNETTRYTYAACFEDEDDENGGYIETITDEYPPLMDDRTLTPTDADTRQKVEARTAELIDAGFVLITTGSGVTALGIRSRETYSNNDPIAALYETLASDTGAI